MLKELTKTDLHFSAPTVKAISKAEDTLRRIGQAHAEAVSTHELDCLSANIEYLANIKMSGRKVKVHDAFFERLQSNYQHPVSDSNILKSCEIACSVPITRETLTTINQKVLHGTACQSSGGLLRTSDEQLGGGRYHVFGEHRCFPPANTIPALMDELVLSCNHQSLPAIAQAAYTHVHFIGIHPFMRANGRTARLLIHTILRQRGLSNDICLPMSLPFTLRYHEYAAGINRVLAEVELNHLTDETANLWLTWFCESLVKAGTTLIDLSDTLITLTQISSSLINTRPDSAAFALIEVLPLTPVFTVNSAAQQTGRSFKRISTAIPKLLEAKIIEQVSKGNRNRIFTCPKVLDAYSQINGLQ